MNWSTVFSVLIGLIGIDLLIIVHELGHYTVAKIFNVFVEKVQIGFGPAFYTKVGKNGTQYCLGLIPYGAFCRMDSYSLKNTSHIKKIIIYLAGPLFNFIFAILCYTIYLCMLSNPFGKALQMSVAQCINEFVMFFNAIGYMITGQAKIGETLSGFFKASLNMGEMTRNGFASGFGIGVETALWITASVSVSLGFANMIPIPALDGGFIFLIIIEMITKRTFSERFQIILQIIGLVLLLVVLPVVRFFF